MQMFFKTSHVFWSCSEDVHLVWILSLDYFIIFGGQVNVVIFYALLLSKFIDSGYLMRGNSFYYFAFF